MSGKQIAIIIILLVVVGGGAFFGGTAYEKNSLANQNLLRDPNQRRGQGGGGQGMAFGRGGGQNGQNGDFVAGQVAAKDDKSITVKTPDGGSKIIFFSDSTTVGKAVQGSASDLNVGDQIVANGKNNSDGTLAAQNIQIRPTNQ